MAVDNLPQAYDAAQIEKKMYEWWLSQGYFKPEKYWEFHDPNPEAPRFCLTIPPPNVTGVLHTGHAITLSLEDLMIRYERMKQKQALYVPGTDHAGIATQNVVERELSKQGIKRKEIGREAFIEKCWEWKEKCLTVISEQIRQLGVSCDWDRERFTLDEGCSNAVRTAFVRLYKKGLIYRGNYMVNWCPGRCESAISDLEAEPEEEQSSLWYLRYPIINKAWKGPSGEWGSGEWAAGATDFIEVATTRPETLVADTGVAMAKNHPLFKKFEGKKAVLPVNGREIPIFTDDAVQSDFGTGALKITPGHDPVDYEIGKRHNLEVITGMDEKARMLPEYAGKYAEMDRFECRKAIVEDLETEGLLIKIEPYTHSVAHCQRCHTVVEPRVSLQWFLNTKPLAEAVVAKVNAKEIQFVPEEQETRFLNWMENIRDWCISRQLWWGHRIPVWYCANGHEICEQEDPTECPICQDTQLEQCADVLDTWFSSGLWPFETLGWPDENAADYQGFYPTDMRETGYDILFFWVARECMMGLELTGQLPYKTVYLHGIVRNEKGEKISKSMENIQDYDPLNLIAKYGADPLRYTLISGCVPGKDQNLNPQTVEGARRFCNKIWQSANFIFKNIQENDEIPALNTEYIAVHTETLNMADMWILSRLHTMIRKVNGFMEAYDYFDASRTTYSFFWDEFCDWYIELSKIRLYDANNADPLTPKVILLYVLEQVLRLFHPIIPFITETLWQKLPTTIRKGPAIIIADYPQADETMIDPSIEAKFQFLLDLIHQIRMIRNIFEVKPGSNVPLILQITEEEQEKKEIITANINEFIRLAYIDKDQLQYETQEIPQHSARIVIQGIIAYIPLEGIIDLEFEKNRITAQINKAQKQIQKTETNLNRMIAKFGENDLIKTEQAKLSDLQKQEQVLREQLEIL